MRGKLHPLNIAVFMIVAALYVFFFWACSWAHGQAVDPALAVVRVHSHGGSACAIATQEGKTLFLSCAHMFENGGTKRPIKMDGPIQPKAKAVKVRPKLVAIDWQSDLSLIELANGPFYAIPVAPPGHQPARTLWSVGYDDMKWPVTKKQASYLYSHGNMSYTREKPWHGRSGGGLYDPGKQVLVGIVHGYEITGHQRGLYVSHAAVLAFLSKHQGPRPEVLPIQQYGALIRPQQRGNYYCPPSL